MITQGNGRIYYTAMVMGTAMAGFSKTQVFYDDNPVPPKPAGAGQKTGTPPADGGVKRIIPPTPPGKPLPRPIIFKLK